MAQRLRTKRSTSTRAKKRKHEVTIIVEGKTEEEYFKAYKKKGELNTVEVKDNGTRTSPLQIVKALLKEREDDSRLEFVAVFDHRKEKGSNTDDDIYHKAIKLCQKEKFIAITSKPSFEFWLILHFKNTNCSMTADEATKELNKLYRNELNKDYKKGSHCTFEDTQEHIQKAKERSEQIWNEEEKEKGSYTNVHELINILQRKSGPKTPITP
ncbi:MAG: RloB domain-containing protein [Acetobacter sp.]|nr:RloB domain-containing protein [Acetobacter sp.]